MDQEDIFKEIVERAPDGITIHSHGILLYANSTFARMVGCDSADEVIGRFLIDFAPPDRQDHLQEKHEKAIADNKEIPLILTPVYNKKTETVTFFQVESIRISFQSKEGILFIHHNVRDLMKIIDFLEEEKKELKEAHSKLQKLISEKRGEYIKQIETQVFQYINQVTSIYIENLKESKLNETQKEYLRRLEINLSQAGKLFSGNCPSKLLTLTNMELNIANLIMQGKSTKEMIDFFNISERTIETHRRKIRVKLGIVNRKINLRSYLLSLQ
jgi:PAS domain S-box-containing protein